MAPSEGTGTVIRTPDQRLRVFVSSTLVEMAAERGAVRAAIERLRLIPVMFEIGARPHPPAQLYRAYLEQSHVFLGLYWERYGWVAPDETVSGLEDEFLLSSGMPRLMYLKEPSPAREGRLAEMLGRLSDNPDSSYRRFTTPEELVDLVEADLAILLSERFEASAREQVEPPRPRGRPPALSMPLTPTIGRASEIDALAALVRGGVRLVTITGIGGVGKTRVAADLARNLHDEFDEARFVRLGDVVDPGLVTATIAATIGVTVDGTQSALDALAASIGDDRALLLLDNLEQVTDAGPELASLLDRCPRLHLVVTSRHLIHLRGEHEYPLAPLAVPASSAVEGSDDVERMATEPAVALFVEHARAARPSFELDESNAAAVAELCRRLDGLPLAIELAAARIRLLPPAALLDRLGDQLHQLTSHNLDLPDRQRTLWATLDWSHQLLEPHEQALFARLAVFSGGAPIDAIEEVCGGGDVGDVLDTLSSLLEKSLVLMVEDPRTGPRIGMLHTVWAYASEQLEATGDLAELRDRHMEWCSELVVRCDPGRYAGATMRWPSVEVELPNVRAASAWMATQRDAPMLALWASALWAWAWLKGRMSEARARIATLEPWLERSDLDLDEGTAARFCEAVGAMHFALGDHEGAERLLRRALDGFDSTGDDGGVAKMRFLLGVVGATALDGSESLEQARRAVDAARTLGLDWGLAFALTFLGTRIRGMGDIEQGRAYQLEALAIARSLDEGALAGQILGHLASAALREGDLAGAGARLAEASNCCRGTRQMEGTVFCLEIGAALALAEGRPRDAVVLLAAADEIRSRLAIGIWPTMRAQRELLVAATANVLDPEAHAAADAEGHNADPFALLPG